MKASDAMVAEELVLVKAKLYLESGVLGQMENLLVIQKNHQKLKAIFK